jgi:RNA polymerase sigma-70 factor (ECF subfamily)
MWRKHHKDWYMLTFKELYSIYVHDVYRFAFWLSGSSVEAEDITAETFVRAWMNFSSIRTETLKGYLLKIARNVYLAQIKKRRKQTELQDTHHDPLPGPEKAAEISSELEEIRTFLQTLPEIDRAAFIMRIQYELPYAEIARVLRISEVAAKVKVHRVRKKLIANRIGKEKA